MKNNFRINYLAVIVFFIAMFVCGCALLNSNSKSTLVINEVVSDNYCSYLFDDFTPIGWIEIKNNARKAVSLEGCTLLHNGEEKTKLKLPALRLEAGELIIVCAGNKIPGSDAFVAADFVFSPGEKLSLSLCDDKGSVISEVSVPALSRDMSYCIDDNGSYSFCAQPTPGKKNVGAFYQSLEEYKAARKLLLTLTEATRSWAEIKNTSDKEQHLYDYYLTDNPENLEKWRFPEYTLMPGEFATVNLGGYGDETFIADLSISNNENTLYLCKDGVVECSLLLPMDLSSVSVGLNASGDSVYYLYPTKGQENLEDYAVLNQKSELVPPSDIYINEFMPKNTVTLVCEDGSCPAWLELKCEKDVNLSNYALSDDSTELDKWRFSENKDETLLVKGGEFTLVYLTGNDKRGEEFHTNFKPGRGEALFLTDLTTMRVQEVFFPDQFRYSDVSYGFFEGSWLYFGKATPLFDNTTKGFEHISDKSQLAFIDTRDIYFSEVCAVKEAKSSELDWVELYNPTEEDIDLSSYYLSNTVENPKLFKLFGSIAGGGYKVIYATDNITRQTDKTAPFSIGQGGERLFIFHENGFLCDSFESGAQRVNISSGRNNGDALGTRVFFTDITKGEKNSEGVSGYAKKPSFSMPAGYYEGSVTVEIISEGLTDTTIYYTTDGSTPTESSKQYSQPLIFDSSTVLSAIAVSDGKIQSQKAVATYLFTEKHTLPVVCISVNEADFEAVSAVINRQMTPVERSCYVEYFEADGTLGTSFPAGMRVGGNGTRVYPQKTFNIYLRGAYGQSGVTYPFFKDYDVLKYKSLTLRNSGQNYAYARCTDTFCSMLVKGMDVDYAESRFVVCYINGEYRGIYDLKENQNEDFYASRFGANAPQVNMIRRNLVALHGSNSELKKVYSMANNLDMSKKENFDEFSEYVDTNAFIDYIVARSYIGDTDFYNQKLVSSSDGVMHWRPVFFDLDFGFAFSGNVSTLDKYFTGEGVQSPNGTYTNMYIPTALIKNEKWREMLIERYAECIKGQFANADELFTELINELKPEMQRHIDRWGKPSSYQSWEKYVDKMENAIANRNEFMKKELKRIFDIPEEKMSRLFGE